MESGQRLKSDLSIFIIFGIIIAFSTASGLAQESVSLSSTAKSESKKLQAPSEYFIRVDNELIPLDESQIEPITIEGIDAFIYQAADGWRVTEKRSGLALTKDIETKQEAIERATSVIKENIDIVEKVIQEAAQDIVPYKTVLELRKKEEERKRLEEEKRQKEAEEKARLEEERRRLEEEKKLKEEQERQRLLEEKKRKEAEKKARLEEEKRKKEEEKKKKIEEKKREEEERKTRQEEERRKKEEEKKRLEEEKRREAEEKAKLEEEKKKKEEEEKKRLEEERKRKENQEKARIEEEKRKKEEREKPVERPVDKSTKKLQAPSEYFIRVDNELIPLDESQIEPITIEGIDAFIYQAADGWRVTEKRSGLALTTGTETKQQAVEKAKKTIKANIHRMQRVIKETTKDIIPYETVLELRKKEEEIKRLEEEKRRLEEEKRQREAEKKARLEEERRRLEEEKRKKEEEKKKLEEERRKEEEEKKKKEEEIKRKEAEGRPRKEEEISVDEKIRKEIEDRKQKEAEVKAKLEEEKRKKEAEELRLEAEKKEAEEKARLKEAPGEEGAQRTADEKLNMKISLDYKDADLVTVLRSLSWTYKLNIVTSPDLKGKVTISLQNVTVKEALEAIITINGLTYNIRGSIIFISPGDVQAVELTSEVIFLKYVKAADAQNLLRKTLSAKGDIKTDEIANSIILTDYLSNIQKIKNLLEKVDIPPRQVLIEAKIVDVTSSDLETLGIVWNIEYAPGHGLFNRDTTYSEELDTTISMAEQSSDLSGSQIKLNTLDFKGLSLTATLDALVRDGRANILASPSIAVLNGQEARIIIGERYPYKERTQTTTGTTETTKFVDIGTTLRVTPQINDDGYITMRVHPEVSSLAAALDAGPRVTTREADTTVRVKQGETLVIGGLIKQSEDVSEDSVPYIGNIPILGLLFKRREHDIERKELAVFITPKILYSMEEKKMLSKREIQKEEAYVSLTETAELNIVERIFREAQALEKGKGIESARKDLSFRKAQALSFYEHIYHEYPESMRAPEALYYAGEIYFKHLKDYRRAKETCAYLISDYPNSAFAQKARDLYERIEKNEKDKRVRRR